MQVELRHQPSFTVARLGLAPDERCQVESGAMHSMSPGVEVHAQSQGGVMKGLGRALLAGESMFISTYTAPSKGGWVDVAPSLPGDMQVIDLDGDTGWCITRGCWIASSQGIELDTKWGGFGNLLGGEGGFLSHVTGEGQAVTACYGAMESVELQEGEAVTIDSGHVVAYADTVRCKTRKVAQGLLQSAKSGENLVFDFTGPGHVLTQTRNPAALTAWMRTKVSKG
ncbi:MAG TPA: TIGR00266 family protein [Streptomyces sp.]|nr:TIGR00266 family protein [Streptomyces sp.]